MKTLLVAALAALLWSQTSVWSMTAETGAKCVWLASKHFEPVLLRSSAKGQCR